CKLPAVDAAEWDWSRPVVDHLDVHVSDFARSVLFYETVLAPLGIPKLYEHEGSACFTHVNVVAATRPTTELHICFHARSRADVLGPARLAALPAPDLRAGSDRGVRRLVEGRRKAGDRQGQEGPRAASSAVKRDEDRVHHPAAETVSEKPAAERRAVSRSSGE